MAKQAILTKAHKVTLVLLYSGQRRGLKKELLADLETAGLCFNGGLTVEGRTKAAVLMEKARAAAAKAEA